MTESVQVVIFGGTAAYQIDPEHWATVADTRLLATPYGDSPLFRKLVTGRETAVWYASRHGDEHLERSARFVNHRANLWAARELGARIVLSWNGVGAIHPGLRVGDLVVPAAIMDWTRNRVASFGEEQRHLERERLQSAARLRAKARTIDHINEGVRPGRAAGPFDREARDMIQVSAREQPARLWAPAGEKGTVYVCTEGPRLETAAEIRLAAELGADVVGMTLCPEVWLAAELGLGFASLCIVTNFATGLWALDPRRDFGPGVAERGLPILLATAERLALAARPETKR